MSIGEQLGDFAAKLLNTIKTESLEWQKKHNAEVIKLKREKEIAETNLRLEIEELEARFAEHKIRVQMEEKHQTRQFNEFLESIDETKAKILEHYPALSKPIALMIHHHATKLLKQAWNSPDAREKLKGQNKFTHLMLTITGELIDEKEPNSLPEKTIKLITNEE